jgi:hypothetical protein
LFLFCSFDRTWLLTAKKGAAMSYGIDRQSAIVLAFGWLVALVTTLI